eukprot:TRINITY_DN5102_c0_g1_i1.p1 TRINITY_DN5102_c0_g1~~TRINITY_DN5102_c0_g1_i1.p1  ORF type:complete len:442 (+),score=166.94 TRINITY_DN5102_c0_g1_i1:170-1495(+)
MCIRDSTTTALEAEAYASWMHGNMLLERDQWRLAKEAFLRAQSIYKELAKVSGGTLKEMIDRRLEEMVPVIRFCDHELKLSAGTATADDAADLADMQSEGMDENLRKRLDSVCQGELRRQAEGMEEIEFDGKRIPMPDKVRLSMVQAQEAEQLLANKGDYTQLMASFDKVFGAYNDTGQLIADEMKALSQKKASSEATADIKQLEKYVHAKKLEHTIHRNEAMAADLEKQLDAHSASVKPDDLMRLYHMLIQNSDDLLLCHEDQEGEAAKLLMGKAAVFRAFRCYFLAGKFSADGEYPEAVALYDRSDGLARLAQAALRDCSQSVTEYSTATTNLQLKIRGAQCVVRAEAFLKANPTASQPEADPKDCLLDHLDEWITFQPGATPNLIEIPPKIEPIPVKPVVFDLAFNFVQMPDVSHRVAKQQSQGMLGKAKGLLGKLWG